MTPRIPLIAGNWKMYKTPAEAARTAAELVDRVAGVQGVEVMIAPAFPALATVAEVLLGARIGLGAQNLFWEDEGAFTGEVAPGMLTALGVRYAIIGHSERRQYFGETDQNVRRRVAAALRHAMVPVVCIGETEAQRDADQTFSVLDKQLTDGLKGLLSDQLGPLVVAYEPVWAIGTGKTATREQAQEVHRFIRQRLAERYGQARAQATRILYGGSVKPENIEGLMAMDDIDGALVGGASLKAETFARIVAFKGPGR
jgi:triosephosphate isomerase